ncbi:hypothetical protein C6A85_000000107515 [Mycobacterium sp. ITM-2017-0098]|nr:hypothetical protein C6A85_000000107515 [Mycobacterium sp. ITM-2017-0098]
MAVTRRDRDDASSEEPHVPWHNQTSTLLGASVAALAAIAVLVGLISYVAGQFDEPEQAPLYYVPPSSSATSTRSGTSASTTTGTITSTSPPITSDINPDATPSSTSGSATTPSTQPPRTREPSTRTQDDDGEPETTRNRPRTNVTRTLYPGT